MAKKQKLIKYLKIAIIYICMMCFTACGKSPTESLSGRWIPEAIKTESGEWTTEGLEMDESIEFFSDGTGYCDGDDFNWVAEEDGRLKIEVKGFGSWADIWSYKVTRNTLELTMDEETTIRFKKDK